ncbi:MAG: nucleotide exchange factor GrpE [Eubacteriaceae bacterium]|jgi:molecular chaperone GrpE|nr:nucleotide exchange factor GrpE [Eubacteriaceae bacterium]
MDNEEARETEPEVTQEDELLEDLDRDPFGMDEAIEEAIEMQEQEEGDKEENLKLQELLDAEKEKYIRLYADFDNYKKRTSKEKSDIYAFAGLSLVEKLLSVLDSFNSALKVEENEQSPVYQGFVMVLNNLNEILKSEGLVQIASVGESFNPMLHNAIATEESDDCDDGIITEEFMAGYTFKDKVVRPAMVKVNKKG